MIFLWLEPKNELHFWLAVYAKSVFGKPHIAEGALGSDHVFATPRRRVAGGAGLELYRPAVLLKPI
jgi:hypothetical protein